jgi:hypothetical protein
MDGRNTRLPIVDRVALAAMFAITLLILAMLCVNARVERQPIPAAVPLAMSPTGMALSGADRRVPTASLHK